ncbi:MAG: phosphatidylserine decarboxylase [Candidatus Handelsmanbacteria bacterium]|nr:phosphatidylserine decarboxylase [Candidatus Handelsmanbacteria bacterium]
MGLKRIHFRDRQSGGLVPESIPAEGALRWFYQTRLGFLLTLFCARRASFCHLYGWWQERPASRRRIAPFAARFIIDLDEVEFPPDQYASFNAFFSRRLKPEARPFAQAPEVLCAPADGKVLVCPCLGEHTLLPVKGALVPVARILGSGEEARPYAGGAALVVRLAPYDYHRYHFPDSGRAGSSRLLAGLYHSVNPLALERVPRIFALNRRMLTVLDADHFGRVAYVEVGAFAVGSMVQTYAPGPVARGQEKGYFQFGGSTLVLFFEPGRVVFDEDLLRDSAQGLEVHVKTGSRIGRGVSPELSR